MAIVQRSNAAPPGARIPLVVLVVALAAGALIFLVVHRAVAPEPPRALVVAPGDTAPQRATR